MRESVIGVTVAMIAFATLVLCGVVLGDEWDDSGWQNRTEGINRTINQQRVEAAKIRGLNDPAAWDRLRATQAASNAEHAAAFGSTCEISATSGEIPQSIVQQAANIAKIRVDTGHRDQSGKKAIREGTGTYIGSGLVLSCNHVTGGVGNQVEVAFLSDGVSRGIVVASDSVHDISLIELSTYPPLAGVGLSLADEPIGATVYPVGYSSGILRGRAGILQGAAGGPVSDGRFANWSESSVPSYPGDSGGPLFNAKGQIVGTVIRSDFQTTTTAVCNGRVQRFLLPWNAKLAAWNAAVAAGHNPWQYGSQWVQRCGPGGCSPGMRPQRPNPGTPIQPYQPPGDGGFVRPEVPVVPRPQGDKGDKGDPGEPGRDGANADEQAILLALFERIKSDATFRGEKGEAGRDGIVDPEMVRAEVEKLIPKEQVVQFLDARGQVVEERRFPLGLIQIDPIMVRTYDTDGKEFDRKQFPYTWGIEVKPLVVKIPGTK